MDAQAGREPPGTTNLIALVCVLSGCAHVATKSRDSNYSTVSGSTMMMALQGGAGGRRAKQFQTESESSLRETPSR
jgi:hypothetical protein